jgi:hypothetical protein
MQINAHRNQLSGDLVSKSLTLVNLDRLFTIEGNSQAVIFLELRTEGFISTIFPYYYERAIKPTFLCFQKD